MKKLLILLTMLIVGIGSMWGDDIVVTINNQTDLAAIDGASDKTAASEATATHKYGVYSGSTTENKPYYTTFTTNSTSGLTGLKIYSTEKIIKPTYLVSSNYQSDYGHVIAVQTSGTTSSTITIEAPSGYRIKNYTMKALSTSDANYFYITPLGESTQIAKGANGILNLSVNNVNATSTSFTVARATISTSTLCISQFTVTLETIYDISDKYISAIGNQATSLSESAYYLLEMPPAFSTQVAYYSNSQISIPNSNYYTRTGSSLTTLQNNYLFAFRLKKVSEGVYNIITAVGSYIKAPTGTGTMTTTWRSDEAAEITFTESNNAFKFSTSGGGMSLYMDRSDGAFYWHDGNNNREIKFYELTITNCPQISYNIYFNNASVKTSEVAPPVTPGVALSTTFPNILRRGFCTYKFYSANDFADEHEITTVPSVNSTVYVKCTCSGPFEFSTEENPKYYFLYSHAQSDANDYYLKNNETAYNSSTAVSDYTSLYLKPEYQWAFIGNPYALKLKNKAGGYLAAANNTGSDGSAISSKITSADDADYTYQLFSLYGFSNDYVITTNPFALALNGSDNKAWVDGAKADKIVYHSGITTSNLNITNWSTANIMAIDASVITDLSDLSNDKKYKIFCERGGLSTKTITVDETSTTYLASTVKTNLSVSAKDFAIISYGGRYYLYSVSDARFVSYYSETEAKLLDSPILLHGTADAIAFNEISTGVFSIRFNNEASKIINSAGDDEYTYGIAINSYNTWDIGNQYVIVEVEDFDSSDALTALTTYMEDKTTQYNSIIATLENINWGSDVNKWKLNYYNFIGDFAGFAGGEASMIAGLKSEGYTSENLQTVQNMNVNGVSYALNMPTTGKFYRFHIGDKYMCNVAGSDNVRTATETSNDASTIFYWDENSYLIAYADGYGFNYGYCKPSGENATTISNAFDFSESATAGYYNIHSSAGTGDAKWSDRNITINASEDKLAEGLGAWTIEEVTSLPLSVGANSYTTFSAPVAVTIPDGFDAYIATTKDGGVIKMKQINKEEAASVAAETGLIIGSSDGSAQTINFNIVGSGTDYSDEEGDRNYLVANWKATNVSTANNYFFGKYSGKYVFAKITGDTHLLAGHKAYLDGSSIPNASSARLAIVWDDDDPTGLYELNDENMKLEDGKYYQNGNVVVVRNGIKYNVAGQVIK